MGGSLHKWYQDEALMEGKKINASILPLAIDLREIERWGSKEQEGLKKNSRAGLGFLVGWAPRVWCPVEFGRWAPKGWHPDKLFCASATDANVSIRTTNDAANEPTSKQCNGRRSGTWTLSQKGRRPGGGAQVVRERAGAQWVAPRWFRRVQAPSGWRPALLPKVVRDLFDTNDDDDDDDANARFDLAMQLEL
ncbi:hypothetical protein AAC387_Pa01g2317 [Persea americana]